LAVDAWVYFWLSTLFRWPVFMSGPSCFDYYSLWYVLKSDGVMPPALFFLLKIVLANRFFVIPYKFQNFFFYFCDACHWYFARDCMESVHLVFTCLKYTSLLLISHYFQNNNMPYAIKKKESKEIGWIKSTQENKSRIITISRTDAYNQFQQY
jgi:hypothetical protein